MTMSDQAETETSVSKEDRILQRLNARKGRSCMKKPAISTHVPSQSKQLARDKSKVVSIVGAPEECEGESDITALNDSQEHSACLSPIKRKANMVDSATCKSQPFSMSVENQGETAADKGACDPDNSGKKRRKRRKTDTCDRDSVVLSVLDKDKQQPEHQQLCVGSDDITTANDVDDSKTTDGIDADKFTILSAVERQARVRVVRVLPDWLQHPTVVAASAATASDQVECVAWLPAWMRRTMSASGIVRLFPVQMAVASRLLDEARQEQCTGGSGRLPPRDLCVSAPTGSGKTLAFVLPIVAALSRANADICGGGLAPQVRALVVLPTQRLASQVAAVFRAYAAAAVSATADNGEQTGPVRVALISGAGDSLARERASLVEACCDGDAEGELKSLVDVVVATPGRLMDHLSSTEGFTLRWLRYLVIDEADRVLEMTDASWLRAVERSVMADNRSEVAGPRPHRRLQSGALTAACLSAPSVPLQKLLFSATLSQNAEKLSQLGLFQPELYVCDGCSVDVGDVAAQPTHEHEECPQSEVPGQFIGRFATPRQLREWFTVCDSAVLKPLLLYHLLKKSAAVGCLEKLDREEEVSKMEGTTSEDDNDQDNGDDESQSMTGSTSAAKEVEVDTSSTDSSDIDVSTTQRKQIKELSSDSTKDLTSADCVVAGWRRVLVFTNSNRSTHRLAQLLRLLGLRQVVELSGYVAVTETNRRRRRRGMPRLASAADECGVFVCSDTMARGMDVAQVDAVVSYDIPAAVRTYIHRVGRTARAARSGHALTMLLSQQKPHFARILEAAGKTIVDQEGQSQGSGSVRQLAAASVETLRQYEKMFASAMKELQGLIAEETEATADVKMKNQKKRVTSTVVKKKQRKRKRTVKSTKKST